MLQRLFWQQIRRGQPPIIPSRQSSTAQSPSSLRETVTKVEWFNPHAFFYIDVKDEKTNEVANWAAELNSPNSLMRLGWTRDSMKVEDVVTVEGSLAKDGSKLLNARSVILTKTGQRLFAGSSEGPARGR